MNTTAINKPVAEFWERESCGQRYASGEGIAYYASQAEARYRLEPWVERFAKFSECADLDVLEMGTGMGADHHRFLEAGARAVGIDFTPSGVQHTKARCELNGLEPLVCLADGEKLPFPNDCFDLIYSWGVAHHSPSTERFVAEAARVLRPGGHIRFAIYHRWSIGVFLIWIRMGLMKGRLRSPDSIVAANMESPGTRIFSRNEARELFERHFTNVTVRTQLGMGDLMVMQPSEKYSDRFSLLVIRFWPRRLIRRLGNRFGGYLLIEGNR
jgi:SAM-dependent methyltransferase